MKETHPSAPRFSGADWYAVGELNLRAGSDLEQEIRAWLDQTLHPLDLSMEFLSRVHRSAREAASRALAMRAPAQKYGHIHVLVFAPRGNQQQGETWGFFRLEKLEACPENEILPDHSIEFYLYMEVQSEAP